MKEKYNKEMCLELLRKTAEECGRYPKRSDFTDDEVCAIKAFLGPWPRALEKAGIKPVRDDGHEEKKREKRIRAKIRKREAHIAEKNKNLGAAAQKNETDSAGIDHASQETAV